MIKKYLSSSLHKAQFLGLKRMEEDGFELSHMNNLAMQLDTFVVVADGSTASEESLQGAEMDFFSLSGEACMEDMDLTMLKLQEQIEGEEILGALMYTCCGRGPSQAGLIPERMSDATRFAKVFPNVPCLGFYANGEFGPVALAGNESVFQIGRSMQQGVSRDELLGFSMQNKMCDEIVILLTKKLCSKLFIFIYMRFFFLLVHRCFCVVHSSSERWTYILQSG